MKNTIRKVIILVIVFAVFLGIPYLAGSWLWLFASWIPAFFVFIYLEEKN